jgi:amino acid transporter
MLALVIAAGIPTVQSDRLDPSAWPALPSVVAAGMLIFVAYEGFELIANASDDVRRPARTLPRAFALCLAVVVLLYVAIAVVVVGSLTPDAIVRAADYALAEAAAASLGQVGFTIVGVSAVLATLSAINATLYGAARLSYTIATEGELPDQLEATTWHQPVGLHVTAGGALLLAVTLPLESISSLASAIFLAVFAVVNAAAVRASDSVPVRTIGVVGGLGCVGSLVVLVVDAVQHDPAAMVALVALVATVMALEFAVLRHRRPERPTIASMGASG